MAMETTLATVWLMMLRMLREQGVDTDALLREVGVPESLLCQPDARLPSHLSDIAFARGVELIGDPSFGLRAATCWHPSNLGTLGYAWLSCATLRRGLRRLERFSKILGNRFRYRCVDEADGFRFIYEHGRDDERIGWPMADFALSIAVDMCRTNYGERLLPRCVRLRRPTPSDPQPYLAFYGGPVFFGQSEDSFLLDPATADRQLPTANKSMASTLDEILAGQLQELIEDDLVTRCRAYLLEALTNGEPSEAELARAMGMSQRSLQRKLGEHGWSYQRVVDDTRANLARRYLADPRRNLTEIAFLLGFSEQSAFSRAFRRWCGTSPTAFRATLA